MEAAETNSVAFYCSSKKDTAQVGRRSLYTSLLPATSNIPSEHSANFPHEKCCCAGPAVCRGGAAALAAAAAADAEGREELVQLYLLSSPVQERAKSQQQKCGGWLNNVYNASRTLKESAAWLFHRDEDADKRERISFASNLHGSGACARRRRKSGGHLLATGNKLQLYKRKWKLVLLHQLHRNIILLTLGAVTFSLLAMIWFFRGVQDSALNPAPMLLHQQERKVAPVTTTDFKKSYTALHQQHHQQQLQQYRQHQLHPQRNSLSTGAASSKTHSRLGSGRQESEMRSKVNIGDTCSSDKIVRLPMRKRKQAIEGGLGAAVAASLSPQLLQYLALALQRHRAGLPVEPAEAPAGLSLSSTIIIRDYMNSQYVLDISVGTPAQELSVIADTGSSDLWVTSDACGIYCALHSVYRHGESSTYKEDGTPYSVLYASGPVKGHMSVDHVELGDIHVEDYLLAEATNLKGLGPAYFFGHFDGILGLGFPGTSTKKMQPFLQAAMEQNLLKQWVFGIHLGSADGAEGELTLGGYDCSHIKGKITYTPVVDERYWMIKTDGLQIGDELLTETKKMIVDSGTSLLVGPLSETDAVASFLGAFTMPLLPKGMYFISCEQEHIMKDVNVRVNGRDFGIRAQDLILHLSDMKQLPCMLGIMGLSILEGRHPRQHHMQPQQHSHSTTDFPVLATVEHTAEQQEEIATFAAEMQQGFKNAHSGSLMGRLLAAETQVLGLEGAGINAVAAPLDETSGVSATEDKATAVGVDKDADVEHLRSLGPVWILGDLFMRRSYTIFDYDRKRIGFATLKV